MLDLTQSSPSHPSEEVLEEYIFERLPETLAAPIEEHLLICRCCQDVVSETDLFVSALKVAARQPAAAIDPVSSGWRNVLPRVGARTSLAPIFVLAVLGFLAVQKTAPEPPAPATVSLSSLRGLDPLSSTSMAPAGTPLQLSIETPDLTSGREYRIEVVDAGGGPVWKGAVTERDGKLAATMSKPLGNGVYWVRLYGAGSELLREFGMSAK